MFWKLNPVCVVWAPLLLLLVGLSECGKVKRQTDDDSAFSPTSAFVEPSSRLSELISPLTAGGPVDLVFILDATQSVRAKRFQQFVKAFAADFSSLFQLSSNRTRVAVVVFAACQKVRTEVDFISDASISLDEENDFSKCTLLQALDGVGFIGGQGSCLGKGLVKAEKILMSARSDARRLVILLTDGRPRGDDSSTEVAKRMHNIGTTVVAFGIGKGAPVNQLVAIATQGHMYTLEKWEDLQMLTTAVNEEMTGNVRPEVPLQYVRDAHCSSLCPTANGRPCCDVLARCACITETRKFGCVCQRGYNGNGMNGNCTAVSVAVQLTCPSDMVIPTDRLRPTAIASWTIPANDPSRGVTITSTANPPVLLSVGTTQVRYTAIDEAGLTKAECSFTIEVMDTEPPILLSCPGDLIETTTSQTLHVSWDAPRFQDNTGTVSIATNSQADAVLATLDALTEVWYQATDDAGHSAYCNFTAALKPYQCPYTEPPLNGALLCENWLEGVTVCAVSCQEGYDFNRFPGALYVCSESSESVGTREWQVLDTNTATPQNMESSWPQCYKSSGSDRTPSRKSIRYYEGPCSSADAQSMLRRTFLRLFRKLDKEVPGFCRDDCEEEGVLVACGPQNDENTDGNTERLKRNIDKQDILGLLAKNTIQSLKSSIPSDVLISRLHEILLKDLDNSIKTSLVPYFETAIGASPQPGLVCEEGHVQKGSVCLECPFGTYHASAANKCIACDYGTFQDEAGEMSCETCPAGTNTTDAGARTANQCREPCHAGTISPTGLQPCVACPNGTFASTEGSRSCQQCPDRMTTDNVGAQSTEDCLSDLCEPGSFSMSGHQPCLPCAPGLYQPMRGQHACLPCPDGSSSQALGASHVTSCVAVVACDEKICQNNGTCVVRADVDVFCKCVAGFTGTSCETDIDDCLEEGLCMHGGTCRDSVAGYQCVCLPGFNRTNCEENVDECKSGPCVHAHVCKDGINSYHCECQEGYSGSDCDINIDECASSPCQNGATCLDQVAAFNCSCSPGYEGTFCEVRINRCVNHPCANNGTCQTIDNGPHCTCAVGFTGEFCQDDVNDCLLSPCKNNATCVDGVDSYSCKCGEGYTGTNCELLIDYCTPNPCQNEGTCISQLQGFRCNCKARYKGVRCEISTIRRCSNTTCQNGGVCVNLFHGPWCNCKPGFTSTSCETDIDDCVGVTCFNGGRCLDQVGAYSCECQPGFNGTLCNLTIDECKSVPCMNGATCLDGANAFTCICTSGFSGIVCEDRLDLCSPNPCQNSALCVNDLDEYRCVCQEGFTGQDCGVNIDDCVMAFCDNGGACIDDVGGYWCKCAVGFIGSDCEINVDDCRDVFCENGGRCIDGVNEARCKCAQGFTGDRCETDVDDCVGVRCSNQGYCVDDVDGFHCQCAVGFSGEFCQTNIQDCDNSTCQNNGTCLDGVNAFHCVCVEGFTGNHCKVDIDDCAGSPCMNGGQCIDNVNSYICLCSHEFTGTHCELVIDNCMHTSCSNGGSCIDDIDTFHCDCVPGFTGRLCESNIDDCWSRPCINKGTCEDGINDYRCLCLQGYTGSNCELMVDYCAINACLNGATCINGILSYTCECVEGYTGAYCQDKTNYCEPQPCLNNGVCQDLEMGFKCLCPRGYQGQSCEIRVDPCLGYICLNRALCQDSPNGPACVCLPGFTGKQCEENIDNCIDMPCQNGGTCEDRLNGYECACVDGFIGIDCQIDIDECRSAPCENRATCINRIINEYRCLCLEGFTGRNCEINIDDCSSNPCWNRGSCVDGINDFKCQCESGFAGDVCEVNIDDCLSMQCRNGGTCIDYVEGFFCLCSPGFTGTLCDVDVDDCAEVECTNGGTCKDRVNEYHCQCVDGFNGSRCEIDIDDCLGRPCLNDARCVDAVNAFTCECPLGFSGVLCDIDVDECQSSPCLNQAQCVDGLVGYSCICEEGFEGVQCENNIDDCQDHPCQNNGTCEDLINSFICQCHVGFSGNQCQMNVIECASSPCKNGGHCVDGINTFSCLCPRGFVGNLCQVDIDDCATSSCQNGARCVDGIDTYSCTCAVGFTGNLCETNIDGCQLNPCDQHGGQCIDGVNNFTCQCFPGFTGIRCELSVDDCYSQPCQNDARCVDRHRDYFCDCIPGFTGKNCEVDISECASAPCLNDGICYDDINSYMCECPDGFTGVMCEVNFDDCASDPCLNGAECQDLPRGFSCYCQDGYRGSRCQERINPCDTHPCLNNGLCIPESNSKGFRCECPHGYRGDFCEEDIDDCLGHMEECLNGAMCEDRVDGFFCRCAPGYAGEKCQLKLSLDFDLIFTPHQPSPNRIHVQPDLYELTMSLWVRPEDLIQKGSLVSYIVYREDNHLTAGDQGSMAVALSLRDYNNMVVQINDEVVEINFRPEREIAWHHIAFTWESESGDWYFYYDGMLQRQGTRLQAGGHIPGGGLLTIGMEHDGIAQQTEPLKNFVGRLSQVNMWQYAMSEAQILSLYGSCGSMGDAMAWPQVLQNGRIVQRRQPSQICRNIDDCASSPCRNGATCHDSVHSYTCDCPDGYEGNECQIVSASCMQDMCLNGGRCYDRTTGRVCSCVRGFTGPRCEVAVNPCESLQCNYGGTCVVQDATKAVCRCPAGFRGAQCNYDKNECSVGISGCSQRCINTLGSYYCDCETGFTLQLDGKTCVDARLCRQNDVIRQANEEWQENCQHCRCVEGIATCTPMTCYNPICPKGREAVREPGYCCPVCSVEKDFCAVDALGNFESFDLLKFYFHGDCRYTMAQDCSSVSFSIHIESEQKGSVDTSRSEAFKKAVFIYLNGDKIELSSTGVKVNSKLVNLPFLAVQHGVIQIDHLQDEVIKVSTNTGLEVLWSASGNVKVSVPRSFRRRLCGLCGNYNGKRKDDKLTKQQLPSRSASEFIHSWKVNGYEHCSLPAILPGPASLPRLLVNRLPACTGLTYHGWRGVLAKCDILKQDVFAECRKVVNPRSFYRLCQQDVCSCGSNEPCYCEAIAAYAQECRRNGIVVRDWRNTTICGIDCPETMLFDDCSPPCIETCYNTASLIEMCRRLPCVARCQCAAGFAFHEERCILKSTCPNLVKSKGG